MITNDEMIKKQKNINFLLGAFRRSLGFSVKLFAGMLGVAPARVSDIERNKNMPKLRTLYRYADLLGLDVTELIKLADTVDDEDFDIIMFNFAREHKNRLAQAHAFNEENEEDGTNEVV